MSFPEPIFRKRKRNEKPNVSVKLYVDTFKLLTRLKTMLKGHKTYITGTLAILTAIGTYLSGDMSLAEAIQLVVSAALGMTVRNAIK
jgi:hypothetical protein